MDNKKVIKSIEDIESDFFETERKTELKQVKEETIDIFPNKEVIPDGPEISLSDDTIRLLSNDDNRYKTIKEIIFEEELRKKDDRNKNYKPESPVNKDTETENKSVLNPDIEKITEVDPDEMILREIKEKKILNNSRNRNQMLL